MSVELAPRSLVSRGRRASRDFLAGLRSAVPEGLARTSTATSLSKGGATSTGAGERGDRVGAAVGTDSLSTVPSRGQTTAATGVVTAKTAATARPRRASRRRRGGAGGSCLTCLWRGRTTWITTRSSTAEMRSSTSLHPPSRTNCHSSAYPKPDLRVVQTSSRHKPRGCASADEGCGWRRRTGIEPAGPRYSAPTVLRTAPVTRRGTPPSPTLGAVQTTRRLGP